jgi:carboxypeptidase D
MDGLWLENGPFRLFHDPADNDNWSIEIDDFSWHKAPAFVLYIDQPVGTGISFSTNKKYPKNDVEVNTDFYYFLKEFLKLHSDKFLDGTNTLIRELFFSGESHAGHYIPSMMNFIRKQNDSADLKIPLSGAAIGNVRIIYRLQSEIY